jgi:hypothetical protein
VIEEELLTSQLPSTTGVITCNHFDYFISLISPALPSLLSSYCFMQETPHHRPVELHPSTPRPILYAHGALGEQASGTGVFIGTPARVFVDDQVFWERLRDCSPSSSSSERPCFSLPWIGFIYFPVDVQGTTLRTSSCINCGPRLRSTHHEWEWSHCCFEHESFR